MLTEQQKSIRRQGIGASESSILFNLNEYCTPYQLWLNKIGEPLPDEENDNLWWGSELEPVVRKRYEYETGDEVKVDTETKFCADSPYMLCHLDGLVPLKNKILEIKTARYNPTKWGTAGTSEIPKQYTIQCQHQLACMPTYDSVDLCVFFWQTKSIVIYNVKRDEIIISQIKNAINRFWNDHVIPKIAPDLFSIEDAKIAYPTDNQTFIDASPIEIETHHKLLEIKEKIKELSEEELKYKTDLIVLIGGASGIKDSGSLLCTYKANKNGRRSLLTYGEANGI